LAERSLRLLAHLAQEARALSLAELAGHLGLPEATVHRLCAKFLAQRAQLGDGTSSANAFDYTLRRWPALSRYADDGRLPIDNNALENQIRPWAVGRKKLAIFGKSAAAPVEPERAIATKMAHSCREKRISRTLIFWSIQ
jgi:hypothetical protein